MSDLERGLEMLILGSEGAPTEGRVALDRILGAGAARVVADGEADWVLRDAFYWSRPIDMTYVGGLLESYNVWRSSDPAVTMVSNRFTLADLERAVRTLLFRKCPLLGCEEWSGMQHGIPVPRRPMFGMTLDESMIDEMMSPLQDRWFRFYDEHGPAPRHPNPAARPRGPHAAVPAADPKSRVPAHIASKPARLDGRRR